MTEERTQLGEMRTRGLVIPEYGHYKKRPRRIKHGNWYVTELVMDGFPRRLVISPTPFDKSIDPKEAEVAAKGWYATGHADKIWLKLVALTQHARTEKRIGVYLLYMCREYIKQSIDPKKLEDLLTPEVIREILEDFAEYEVLILSMQLDDGMKRLRTYDLVKEERTRTKKVLAEEHAALLLSKWSVTEEFKLPSETKHGWRKIIPTSDTLKGLLPWILLLIFIAVVALVWINTLAPSAPQLIGYLKGVL